MTITSNEKRNWTEEAVEAMTRRPGANPALHTTEMVAWRAGFVAGWIALRVKLAGESSPGGAVPIGR